MIKQTITQSIRELVTNRYLTVLSIVTLVLMLLFVAYILISVHPSEVQLLTHYTAYGLTHFYRDQWYYLFSFGGIAILAAIIHISIAIKLYITKGHPLAIMFAWMGIGVIIFAWITYVSLGIWKP